MPPKYSQSPAYDLTRDVNNLATRTQTLELSAKGSQWYDYAPDWTATANPTIGNGTLLGRYMRVGQKVTAKIFLETNTTGTATTFGTGVWCFSLPFVPSITWATVGSALAYDASTADGYAGVSFLDPTGTVPQLLQAYCGSVPGTKRVKGTDPFTFSTGATGGDRLIMSIDYETDE